MSDSRVLGPWGGEVADPRSNKVEWGLFVSGSLQSANGNRTRCVTHFQTRVRPLVEKVPFRKQDRSEEVKVRRGESRTGRGPECPLRGTSGGPVAGGDTDTVGEVTVRVWTWDNRGRVGCRRNRRFSRRRGGVPTLDEEAVTGTGRTGPLTPE